MKHRYLALLLALAFAIPLGVAGCSSCSTKPSEENCKKAIDNIRRVRGLEESDLVGAHPRAALRSCQGNESKGSVKCFIAARTVEDLRACQGEIGAQAIEQEREIQRKRLEKLKEEEEKKKEGEGSSE